MKVRHVHRRGNSLDSVAAVVTIPEHLVDEKVEAWTIRTDLIVMLDLTMAMKSCSYKINAVAAFKGQAVSSILRRLFWLSGVRLSWEARNDALLTPCIVSSHISNAVSMLVQSSGMREARDARGRSTASYLMVVKASCVATPCRR